MCTILRNLGLGGKKDPALSIVRPGSPIKWGIDLMMIIINPIIGSSPKIGEYRLYIALMESNYKKCGINPIIL